jgi:hypothetical protein
MGRARDNYSFFRVMAVSKQEIMFTDGNWADYQNELPYSSIDFGARHVVAAKESLCTKGAK